MFTIRLKTQLGDFSLKEFSHPGILQHKPRTGFSCAGSTGEQVQQNQDSWCTSVHMAPADYKGPAVQKKLEGSRGLEMGP